MENLVQLQQSHKGELVQDISEYHGGGHLWPLIHEYQDGGTSHSSFLNLLQVHLHSSTFRGLTEDTPEEHH